MLKNVYKDLFYISQVCLSSIRWVSVHFCDAFQNEDHVDQGSRERTLFIFFILQKHKFLLLLCVYSTNKSRPLTDLIDVLLLSLRSKMTE